MHTIIYIFIIQFFLVFSLQAKEPILAMLLNVNSNELQKFGIGNYNFYCIPYGITTLESLLAKSENESSCKKSIEMFYKKHPNLKYYSLKLLKLKQEYHVDFKNTKCILYAKGQMTLSELLVKEGLALLNPSFEYIEFEY